MFPGNSNWTHKFDFVRSISLLQIVMYYAHTNFYKINLPLTFTRKFDWLKKMKRKIVFYFT